MSRPVWVSRVDFRSFTSLAARFSVTRRVWARQRPGKRRLFQVKIVLNKAIPRQGYGKLLRKM